MSEPKFQTLLARDNATLAACRELGATFPAPVNPQDLPEVVASIPTGPWSPPPPAPGKPVVQWFYTSSVTGEERVARTNVEIGADAIPPPDAGDWTAGWGGTTWRMRFQTWSATSPLTHVQAPRIDAGAVYVPDDGRTRICVALTRATGADETDALVLPLYFNKSNTAAALEIDWGDGSPAELVAAAGNGVRTHAYPARGRYVIALRIVGGTGAYTLGNGTVNTIAVGGADNAKRGAVASLFFGADATIGTFAFANMPAAERVFLPAEVASVGGNFADAAPALRGLVVPPGVTGLGAHSLRTAHSIQHLIAPHGFSLFGLNILSNARAIREIVIPASVENLGNGAFATTSALNTYVINGATPPTLYNAPYVASSATRFFVPDASLEAYKAAPLWSDVAAFIHPMSEIGDDG